MKTFSKRSVAIVLAVLMMLSMVIVGSVTTNAADLTVESGYYMMGTLPDTSWSTGLMFMKESSSDTVGYLTFTLEANSTYEFKTKSSNSTWRGNNGTMSDSNCTGWTFSTSAGNCKIKTTIAGDYVFAYDTSTHKMSVTYPTEQTEETTTTATESTATEPSTAPSETEATEPSESTKTNVIYFINSGKWSTVNAYVWTNGGSTLGAWPGEAMEKTELKDSNGYDVYSYEFNSLYNMVIFTNGSVQTGNLTVENNKYYDYANNEWYDSIENGEANVNTYYLSGTMNGWSTKNTPFVDGTVSVELEGETTYSFKVTKNDSWDGALGNNGTMTSEHCTGWLMESSAKNCDITTTYAGTYIFSFDSSTDRLTVTYPTAPVDTEYTVVYSYTTEDGTQTLTKTVTTSETDANAIANLAVPTITNATYSYALGECTLDGTTVNATLDSTKKEYTVSVDGKEIGKYGYKDTATVELADGTEYTFFVTGDIDIVSEADKEETALSLDSVTVTDEKVAMDFLATANVENFDRMGVVFATSEKSEDEIKTAVANVTTGTSVSNGIAVHNSEVNAPNASGSYQFTYAPYVSRAKATSTLYFYTFAVDTNGEVSISSTVKVDLANIVA
jgi:hypothetical protein